MRQSPAGVLSEIPGRRMGERVRNLTDVERRVLDEPLNLADGHAYRPLSVAESALVAQAGAILLDANRMNQHAVELAYLQEFFNLARQRLDTDECRFFMLYTASMGLEIIANYLRLRGMNACLVEPVFDNLHDILSRHDIPTVPFPDYLMDAPSDELSAYLDELKCDAIVVVSPNNPTGKVLSAGNLKTLLAHCQRTATLLIVDACFRFYLPVSGRHDQYAMLIESGIEFVVLEDTGKTWPTREIKAPFLVASATVGAAIARIHTDFLLHVSPFALELLTGFMRSSADDGLAHVRHVVAHNRSVLHTALAGTALTEAGEQFMSVAWLRVDEGSSAQTLHDALAAAGVHVLLGRRFFWSDHARGDHYLRVALTRDPAVFGRAAEIISTVCRNGRDRSGREVNSDGR